MYSNIWTGPVLLKGQFTQNKKKNLISVFSQDEYFIFLC